MPSNGTSAKPLKYEKNHVPGKRWSSQLSRHENTSVLLAFHKPCRFTGHMFKFITVCMIPDNGTVLHKRTNQRKISSCFHCAALHVAARKRGISFVCPD